MAISSDTSTQLRQLSEALSKLESALFGKESPEHIKEALEALKEPLEQSQSTEFKHAPAPAKFLSDISDTEVRNFFRDYGWLSASENSPSDFDLAQDVYARLRRLRNMLVYDNEFAARHPKAYELLFGEETDHGLFLPSFGIYVAYHDPQKQVAFPFEPRKYIDPPHSETSGDAHSKTWPRPSVVGRLQDIVPTQEQNKALYDRRGYLRSVLLAILSRDEYWERVDAYRPNHVLGRDPSFVYSPVRITDLRLATDLEPRILRRQLGPVLRQLQRPATAEQVVQWKHQVLKRPDELVQRAFRDQEIGIVAVSFAAAALLLFIDLDMTRVEEEDCYRLADKIESLATTVRKLMSSLDGAAGDVETLLANRPDSRAPRPTTTSHSQVTAWEMSSET